LTISTLNINYTKKKNKKTNNNIFNTNTCNYTKSVGSPSTMWRCVEGHVSQRDFFHSNNSFLKFINDDNNIYALINFNENTKNFIIQIIIFLVAII
jgi:hypothetical protein